LKSVRHLYRHRKRKDASLSCVITDWADQPEATFCCGVLGVRAHRDTVAIAIVDHEPTAVDARNWLDFLIYRPISDDEAAAVLAKRARCNPLNADRY
jgi:hypothetical protein